MKGGKDEKKKNFHKRANFEKIFFYSQLIYPDKEIK